MIRVLIVDDSAMVRKVLSEQLAQYPDIQVVGCAVDPYNARDLIVELHPDVLTLDIEMPRMDGLSFLAKLMRHHPIPVVVVSSLTPANSATAIRALELGAVDVLCKPGSAYSTADISRRLAYAIRAAAGARVQALSLPGWQATQAADGAPSGPGGPGGSAGSTGPGGSGAAGGLAGVASKTLPGFQLETTQKVLALGASTGGTTALEVVLSGLPPTTPGTVIVQHMPEAFTGAFAERLNTVCAMEVREARDGDPIVTGCALVAPGNKHMIVQRSGARYHVRVIDGPAVHHQRPAVDVLFESVAKACGRNAVGAVLTGMGADGAKGLLAMKTNGARTVVQDEKTSVVFGMPKEAIRLGGADEIVPLPQIAPALLRALSDQARAA